MYPKIHAYLLITDFEVDPDEITKALAIEPSKVRRAGDLLTPRGTVRIKQNSWELHSGLDTSEAIENHVLVILKKLEKNWCSVVEVCSKYYVELACVIYVEEKVPKIQFSKYILEKLVELNAEIDIDLYLLYEFPDEVNEED